MEQYIPRTVQEAADLLEKHTNHKPPITRLDTGWQVTMQSERVLMTMEFRRHGRKWKYHSTLTVDGVRRALAEDVKHFALIWENPDQSDVDPTMLDAAEHADFQPPQLGEMPADQELPVLVDKMYRALTRLVAAGAQVQLGYAHETWQIMLTVINPAGRLVQMYIAFIAGTHGHYTPQGVAIQIGLEGKDYTDEYEGDASDILIQLMASAPPQKTAAKPIGTPTQGARANSVEARRATVRRI